MVVTYDAVIDGVCRKTNSCAAKKVQLKKNLKLDFDTFLYQSNSGILDTSMRVAKIDKTTNTSKDGPEVIGTIELHLHVTRQLSIEHDSGSIHKYNDVDCHTDDLLKNTGAAKINTQFVMAFEENGTSVDKRKMVQEQKKMESKRSGTGP